MGFSDCHFLPLIYLSPSVFSLALHPFLLPSLSLSLSLSYHLTFFLCSVCRIWTRMFDCKSHEMLMTWSITNHPGRYGYFLKYALWSLKMSECKVFWNVVKYINHWEYIKYIKVLNISNVIKYINLLSTVIPLLFYQVFCHFFWSV